MSPFLARLYTEEAGMYLFMKTLQEKRRINNPILYPVYQA